jgi:hypothetical protein
MCGGIGSVIDTVERTVAIFCANTQLYFSNNPLIYLDSKFGPPWPSGGIFLRLLLADCEQNGAEI